MPGAVPQFNHTFLWHGAQLGTHTLFYFSIPRRNRRNWNTNVICFSVCFVWTLTTSIHALRSTAAPRQKRWLGRANSAARWHSAAHCTGDRFSQSHHCHQMAAMMALRIGAVDGNVQSGVRKPTFQLARSQWGASRCTARSRNLRNIQHKHDWQPSNNIGCRVLDHVTCSDPVNKQEFL